MTVTSTAAERAFLAYEPYLRMAVRRQLHGALRAKLDSVDIVQSVWADLLSGFREAGWRFNDRSHLRALPRAGDPQPAHRSPPPASSGARSRNGRCRRSRRAICPDRISRGRARSPRARSSGSGCSRSARRRTATSCGRSARASRSPRSPRVPGCTRGASGESSMTCRAVWPAARDGARPMPGSAA